MGFTSIGLLHPGEMGAAIGAVLVGEGRTVSWASSGRGPATAARAAAAGLADVGTVSALLERCDLVLSVCPPHAALDVARAVSGFTGCYVDANAIAPTTAREAAALIRAGGGRYVDGGIIGPPPGPGRPTRLWVSGPGAGEVAATFAGTVVTARVAHGDPVAASALKMCFAAWTKGTAALLLGIRALADAERVEEHLLEEWAATMPELAGRSLEAAHAAATKGWRWVGEMHEIAETFRGAGLPGGFHEAAADLYGRLARSEGARADAATLGAVLAALVAPGGGPA